MALLEGDASAVERDAHLAAMVNIVRNSSVLGDFGAYRSVIEISPGWELFTPGADANPTLGEPGSSSTSPTAILTIFFPADAPSDAVDRDIAAIVGAHPWEVPVIELSETSLLVRRPGQPVSTEIGAERA